MPKKDKPKSITEILSDSFRIGLEKGLANLKAKEANLEASIQAERVASGAAELDTWMEDRKAWGDLGDLVAELSKDGIGSLLGLLAGLRERIIARYGPSSEGAKDELPVYSELLTFVEELQGLVEAERETIG